ncbi:MAG: hypothetical protein TE42_02385 [Candidatus Synechococcus spongiarum SP3]|uniref:ParB/Sulfiredoxin domain-containing protein n=1 Tax=Candidatus Synechococcus spongiarum SP3 TaxID=1604020 RepID=A0A0G2IWU0_9SYNE|nr:MAG: hypothetical protein TE42_02385 [Candidatus Synechococcus spongiarum SP3]
MEFKKPEKVAVEQLRLDHRNPRLVGEGKNASQEEMIARLYLSADLGELLQSISANGYMDIEPLIVMPDPQSSDNKFIVLEGNRRLAALRLLREPDLVSKIKKSENLSIPVPPMDENVRDTLNMVSVCHVNSREAARSFIGFKHINGPAKWDAYAKAQFAAEWYKSGRDQGVDLKSIANAIGDKHDTIKRMVSAVYVLQQAKKEKLFDIEDRYSRRFNFSHLYTALSRSQYMDYLGLEDGWARHDPQEDQVPQDKLKELQNVLVWIYGSKEEEKRPVIQSQNPDIKRLGEVLAHAEGRHVLETKHDLDAAYASTESVDNRFKDALIKARDNIRDAAVSLRAYDGQDQSLLDIAADIKEVAETVHDRMRKKWRSFKEGDEE